MEFFDKLKGLDATKFKEGFGKKITEAIGHASAFDTALADAKKSEPVAKIFDGLTGAVSEAQAALDKLGKQVGKKFELNSGVEQSAVDSARNALEGAKTNLDSYLEGLEAKLQGNPVKAPEALSNAYNAANKASKEVVGKVSSNLGMMNTQGFGHAVKHNLKGMNVFDSAVREGRTGPAFARVAGVTAGGALMADAVFRGKTNGEDRSAALRMAEFVAGAVAVGGSLAIGRAV